MARFPSLRWLTSAPLAQAAVAILGLYLIAIHLGGLVLVRYTVARQETILQDYLDRLARQIVEPRESSTFLAFIYNRSLEATDEEALETYRQTRDWSSTAASLAAAVEDPHISSAEIILPNGEVIMRSDGSTPPFGERVLFPEEQGLVQQALAVGMVSPEITPQTLTKRLYAPIRAADGYPMAVLRLEIDPDNFLNLRVTRNRFFLSALASLGIVGVLWLLTVRLVRRTIEAERSAARADRLRALGTMTAGIAHEIRNPLNILALQVEELRAYAKELADAKQRSAFTAIADDLQSETNRLKQLTETFLTFSKAKSAGEFRALSVDVNTVATQLMKLWEKSLDLRLRKVVYENPEKGLRVAFTEDRLRQVLLNLLRNADEALGPREGEIRLRVQRDGGFAQIVVEDNGPGIEANVLAQIFDPFFTTRAEGTGLGLSLSRALAEAAGGTLTAESVPGRGARFILRLKVVG